MNTEELTLAFYRLTKETRFSSDTFRELGFGKHFDHSNAIGAFFTNLKGEKLVREVGQTKSKIPSNKGRRIPVYAWSRTAVRRFTRVRKMDEFL